MTWSMTGGAFWLDTRKSVGREPSRVCKIMWFVRKTNHVFHWKWSVVVLLECHLQINRAAKITWSESWKCSSVILWYISSFKDSSCNGGNLPPKGHEANPTEVFQAVVQQNVSKWQALGRRAEKYGPATIREAQIAVFLADYTLTQQYLVTGTKREQQAAIL